MELLEQVLADNPSDARAWEEAAVSNMHLGNLDRAEACLRRSLELEAKAQGYARLAGLLLNRNKLAECDQALERGIALDPAEGYLYIVRGTRYAGQQRFSDAREQYERAVEVDPSGAGPAARKAIERLERATDQRPGP